MSRAAPTRPSGWRAARTSRSAARAARKRTRPRRRWPRRKRSSSRAPANAKPEGDEAATEEAGEGLTHGPGVEVEDVVVLGCRRGGGGGDGHRLRRRRRQRCRCGRRRLTAALSSARPGSVWSGDSPASRQARRIWAGRGRVRRLGRRLVRLGRGLGRFHDRVMGRRSCGRRRRWIVLRLHRGTRGPRRRGVAGRVLTGRRFSRLVRRGLRLARRRPLEPSTRTAQRRRRCGRRLAAAGVRASFGSGPLGIFDR